MFVLAMFWNRTTEPGAFWGMLIAQAWGIVRFILDMVYPSPLCGEPDDRPGIVKDFNAYYHTISQIVLAFIAAALISWVTPAIPEHELAGLTYWKRFEKPLHEVEWEKTEAKRKELANEIEIPVKVGYASQEDINGKEPAVNMNNGTVKDEPQVLSPTPLDAQREKRTLRQRFVNAMLGPPDSETKASEEEIAENYETHEQRLKFLEQTPFMYKVLNVNAVLVMTVCVFLYGFFY